MKKLALALPLLSFLFVDSAFTFTDKDHLADRTRESVQTDTSLVVSQNLNMGIPRVQLYPGTVYSSYSFSDNLFSLLPAGYEDHINSFHLPKGFMVVFAENNDGTGESACFVASQSAINANLPARLRNNISYIRYMRINNPFKKGMDAVNSNSVTQSAVQWYYGWSFNKPSFAGQQFVPMTWGRPNCNTQSIKYLIDRKDIDHLLSFNEPDNKTQSNIEDIDTAIAAYQSMQLTGLRLGSPALRQEQAFGEGRWLPRFMLKAKEKNVRVDFIAVHWYDWGNQNNNKETDALTAKAVFERFVVYIQKVHSAYPALPIWVTEYNANPKRTSEEIHKNFMQLSTEWMNAQDYIERYAYFFPKALPDINPDNTSTTIGKYWKDLTATKSFNQNINADAVMIKGKK